MTQKSVLHRGTSRLGSGACRAALLAWPVLILAAPAAAQQAASLDQSNPEEITVTAQKRAESLVTIPLTVSVVSAAEIASQRIETIDDLAGKLPNMDIKEYIPGSDPVITLRGVGLNDFSVTGNPSVGVYKDEIYLPTNAMLNLDLYDLQRMEVLKGPQGTLYGRNSTAGAINLVSANPSDKLEGYASLGYGNYGDIEAEGWINLPISDQLQFRLSGKIIDQLEGYWTDTEASGSDNLGKRSVLEGRAQVSWQPDSTTDINLKIEGFHQDSQLGQPQAFGTINPAARVFPIAAYYQLKPGEVAIPLSVIHAADPAVPALPGLYYVPTQANPATGQTLPGNVDFAALGGVLSAPGSVTCGAIAAGKINNSGCTDVLGYSNGNGDPFVGAWPLNSPLASDQGDYTLTIHHDIGAMTLTSITGVIDFWRDFVTDTNGGPYDEFIFNENSHIDQVSQEFRLSGQYDDVADWLGGIYYSHDHVRDITSGNLSGFLFTDTVDTADQTTDVAAIYANADWHLADRLTLTTGLRYTWEQRHYAGGTTDVNPFGTSILVDLLKPGCIAPCQLTHIDQTISDRNISFRTALDYKITDHSIVYGSISRSTKSGGFFDGITTAEFQLEPYKPEQLTAYELGYKLGTPTLYLNPSAFYYDYNDVQVFAPDTDPTTGVTAQRVINVPNATVYGFDFEGNWQPVEHLTLGAGLGLLHAELGSFTIASGPVPAGNRMPNAPDVTVNGLIRYDWPIGNALTAAAQSDFSYVTKTFKEATDTPYLAADSHVVANARLELNGTETPFGIAFWIKNIGDTRYVSEAQNLGLGVGYRFYDAPRTFGLTASYKF